MRRSGSGGLASDEMGEKSEGGGRSRFWAAKWRDEAEKKPEARARGKQEWCGRTSAQCRRGLAWVGFERRQRA
jgi:hypothetical protein